MKKFSYSLVLASGMLLFCLLAQPCLAQVEFLTPAQQKKEMRRSLKEAKRLKTDYNESHLNMRGINFKRGESGRKRVKDPQEQDEMLMNEDGTAATKPKLKPKKNKATKKKE
jgi:hypothetical protein